MLTRRPPRPGACSSCGEILLGRRTRFCSSCAPKRGSKSDPRYGSRQWKRTVKAVKVRDHYRCQHCGTTERLVVDHRTPHDRYPGSFYDMANLWTLCQADNNSKRDLTVEEWRAALARRARKQAVSEGPSIRGTYSIRGRRR
jgi:5-methylcytosine-specific restriction endonuclease McrA